MTDELTLDPADWGDFRALAHRMVDDMLVHLESLPQQPAWREMPPEVRASFAGPVPRSGAGDAAAYEAFVQRVMPYTSGNQHPRFWGWVKGNGTPLAMMAEMLAAGINPHLAGFNQGPALVEHEVIRWLASLLGMPADASGALLSGGTMANTIGMAVARHAGAMAAGWDVKENGLQGDDAPRLVFYGSSETHNWARKAAELLGLGNRAFRRVPVDDEYRIRVPELERMIVADREAGLHPFCVVGTTGTVNTGATDDLSALADVCEREGLWFHVDGAFGALAYLSDELRPALAGMERADSLAFDLHKWGSMPFECACILVRDAAAHRAAFASSASYLAPAARGVIAGGLPFADRAMELTRNFKALKVWMSLQANGADHHARIVEQNVHQARALAAMVEAHPSLELLAPVPLNVVCFRFTTPSARAEALDALNEEILLRLQERGLAVPSGTRIGGRYAIRVANVNHRSRNEDFVRLVADVVCLGEEIVRETAELPGVRSAHLTGALRAPPGC